MFAKNVEKFKNKKTKKKEYIKWRWPNCTVKLTSKNKRPTIKKNNG